MKILVTGATNGMGKGVVEALAKADDQKHEILLLCRSKGLAEEVIQEIKTRSGNSNLSYYLCDLAKLAEVNKVIAEIKNDHNYLDGIFVNAGLGYAKERVETEDGLDSHFQVNYLSHFLLTNNLLDLLEKSPNGGRVIFNASQSGEIFWDDMQMKEKWSYEDGIHQAMVAKRMFMQKLNRLYGHREKKLSFLCFQIHKPVWTNQINIIPGGFRFMANIARVFGRFISMEEAGEIIVPLFLEIKEESLEKAGKFLSWKDKSYVELSQDPNVLDENLQDKLWDISLELCKDRAAVEIAGQLPAR